MINIVTEDYNQNSYLNNYTDIIEENTKYFIVFEQDIVSSIVSIKYLDWDSNIFNKKIGLFNICYGKLNKHTSKLIMDTVNQFCVEEKYECIFAKVGPDDYYTMHMLENVGYNLMDTIVTFKKKIKKDEKIYKNDKYTTILLDESDINEVINIIDNLYSYGRFFQDEHLDNNKTNEFYKKWIINEIRNTNIDVIGIKENDRLLGFASCKYQLNSKNELEGVISLVGISKLYQGLGIGKILMDLVFNHFIEKKVNEVYVGTQINNIEAINLYLSKKFKIRSSVNTFHKWLGNN